MYTRCYFCAIRRLLFRLSHRTQDGGLDSRRKHTGNDDQQKQTKQKPNALRTTTKHLNHRSQSPEIELFAGKNSH